MAHWQRRLLVLLLVAAVAWAGDHKYNKGDPIELYANKIGPFANPT